MTSLHDSDNITVIMTLPVRINSKNNFTVVDCKLYFIVLQ